MHRSDTPKSVADHPQARSIDGSGASRLAPERQIRHDRWLRFGARREVPFCAAAKVAIAILLARRLALGWLRATVIADLVRRCKPAFAATRPTPYRATR